MKKTILSAAIMMLSISAQASSSLEQQVLEQVIANSASIQLIDSETNEALPQDQQLPTLIARALSQNYLSVDAKKGGTLSSTSVTCENTTPNGLLGSSSYRCRLMIGDGEFTRSGLKTLTPETESAYLIDLEVSRVVVPNAKPTIKKTAKVSIAG